MAVVMAYHGYVESVLRYGIMFWGNSVNKTVIFRAQKRNIRAIKGLKSDDSCKPVFKQLNILTLPSLYIFEVAVFVQQNQHIFPTFDEQNPQRSHRHGHKICAPKHKTALFAKSFFGMAPKIYNKVPNEFKNLPINLFKKHLRKLLINKAYYSTTEFLNDIIVLSQK